MVISNNARNNIYNIKSHIYKYGKLAWEHNPIKAPMGVGRSVLYLLTVHKFNKTDAARSFPNDQHNLPRAAQYKAGFKTCFFER